MYIDQLWHVKRIIIHIHYSLKKHSFVDHDKVLYKSYYKSYPISYYYILNLFSARNIRFVHEIRLTHKIQKIHLRSTMYLLGTVELFSFSINFRFFWLSKFSGRCFSLHVYLHFQRTSDYISIC